MTSPEKESGALTKPAASDPKTQNNTKLDANVWIEAAFEVLASSGIHAVRIEPLAKSLGITKGSFYWHFKDRPALFSAMLTVWRQRATLGVIERLERGNSPAQQRLRRLVDLPLAGSRSARGASVEAAIRLWAKMDAQAAAAVEEVDGLRLAYITSLLTASGITPEESPARAVLVYAYILAEATVSLTQDKVIKRQCQRILLEA